MAARTNEESAQIYAAIQEAVKGGALPLAVVATRVGYAPREVIEVLLRFDRASRISIVPADSGEAGEAEFLVRACE